MVDWIAASAIASVLGALASGAVAIFTARLASSTSKLSRATFDLAKETVDATKLADRHHQETRSPLLYLQANFAFSRRSDVDGVRNIGELSGSIVNLGGGPAQNVRVEITPGSFKSKSFYIGMVGPHAPQDITRSMDFGQAVNPVEAHWPFEVRVTYESVFGAEGLTLQRSHSGLNDDLEIAEGSSAPVYIERALE